MEKLLFLITGVFVGVLLIGLVTGLVIWGFNFIRSLIRKENKQK